jgi:hypothetical protein
MEDLRLGPVTVLVQHPSDPSQLVANHRLPTGLRASDDMRHLIETIQPVREKVALLIYPWELPILEPDSQVTGLSSLVRSTNELFLIIRQRDDVRTDLLQQLGELEVLHDAVRVARDPYDLSLFPVRYYHPYVKDVNMPFLATEDRDPFLHNFDQNPYYSDKTNGPHEGLYYYPFVTGDEHEDGYLRHNAYSYDHPNIKPVAIVLGGEFAIFYSASYPILSTVPIVAEPTPSSVAASVPGFSPLLAPPVKVTKKHNQM